MAKSNLKSRPPRLSDEEKARAAAAFIEAAGQEGGEGPSAQPPILRSETLLPGARLEDPLPVAVSSSDRFSEPSNEPQTTAPPTQDVRSAPPTVYPWEEDYVRDDVKKGFGLRFPEPLLLKLQFISDQTGRSMHSYCMDVLGPAIEAGVEQLIAREAES